MIIVKNETFDDGFPKKVAAYCDNAWNKIRVNKGAPGCDNVTVEEFQSRKKEYIKQLYIELKEERYTPHPAKMAVITTGDKNKTISILSAGIECCK